MKPDQRTCAWCGGAFAVTSVGRPREYCKRSHRQRAYEARRLGERMGLDSGEALVSTEQLEHLRDLLVVLEAALDDVESDLRGRPAAAEYQAAFRHLYSAAAPLRGAMVEARAVGS